MASSSTVPETSRKTTTSRCSPEMDQCRHVFEIDEYSLQAEGIGVGRALHSATFAAGAHDWRVSYYPNGHHQNTSNYASVFLGFIGKRTCPVGTQVRGLVSFDLVSPTTGDPMHICGRRVSIKHTVLLSPNSSNSWGHGTFILRRLLESSPSTYLPGDRLAIECKLSVLVGSRVSGEPPEREKYAIEAPPPENLGRLLLGTKDGLDVTFNVQGVVFHAHKVVLAARSPVFKAELFGLIGDEQKKNVHHRHITIHDMEPGVFKALLHFIYTDSLPSATEDGDCECDLDDEGVVKHLLVAADRYAMDRMRLMCESMLCERLGVENLAATLALADQHYCGKLKDACVSFMSSRKRIRDVMATKGYEQLKKSCPSIAMVLLEEAVKSSVC